MKKTLVSLAAVAALTTGAMAADKGIDITTTGQGVLYYQTVDDNGKTGGEDKSSLFRQDNSAANFAIQLNLDADLKNGFTFGSTFNYLGALGLDKNMVGGTMQSARTSTGNDSNGIADEVYMAQLYVAKKMGNTTLKLGRQELPKSLSPFAYSEGWNVFKNTFDAILVVNTDIPDTTLVGAYVSKGNGNGIGNNMSSFTDLVVSSDVTRTTVTGAAYMATVQNKSIPMTTITASYYDLAKVAASAGTAGVGTSAQVIWGSALVAGKDMPLGLKIGLQGGVISADDLNLFGTPVVQFSDTTAYGAKIGLAPVDGLSLCLAYTSVDGDDKKVNVAVKNTTGTKTPLYTQMIANQNAIALDNNTFLIKGVVNTGDYGKIIAQYGATAGGKSSLVRNNSKDTDFGEFDLIYKVKAANINWLAAWVNQSWSEKDMKEHSGTKYRTKNDIIRLVARYNF